jgi:hypothetical protein
MLTPTQAMEAARLHGASFSLDPEGKPHVAGAHSLPLDLMAALKGNRDEIIAILAAQAGLSTASVLRTLEPAAYKPELAAIPGTPADWIEGAQKILGMPCPVLVTTRSWRNLQHATRRLFERRVGENHQEVSWVLRAAEMGWPATALFGADQLAPDARPDMMGFAWLALPTDQIITLDDATLTLRTTAGATQRFYRSKYQENAAVLPWSPGFGSRAFP